MKMADAALPVEDERSGEAAANEKSLREQLNDSWNGQGYYAKLMTQLATPKKEQQERTEEPREELCGNAKKERETHAEKKSVAGVIHTGTTKQPSTTRLAAAPLAAVGSGGNGVAKKLSSSSHGSNVGNALASRATANAGWMLAGVVGTAKSFAVDAPVLSPGNPFGSCVSSTASGEASEATRSEIELLKAQLASAKEEAETLKSDAALAESEAESLTNTLESQTLQLRASVSENKALKAELARIKARAAAAAAAMAESIKNAVDQAAAQCARET
jgi:hypothetical protein